MPSRFVEVSAPLEARVAQSGGGATLRAVLAGLYARNATAGAGAGFGAAPLSGAEVADAALADRLRAALGMLAVAVALWAARYAAIERQVGRAVREEAAGGVKAHAD
jgi:hypothetical protein